MSITGSHDPTFEITLSKSNTRTAADVSSDADATANTLKGPGMRVSAPLHRTNPHILDAAELRHISGKQTAAAVRRWASSQGIRIRDGDDGPWTTIDAVNAALGLAPAANDQFAYGEDVL